MTGPASYEPTGVLDEAFTPEGTPRHAYRELMEGLDGVDLSSVAASVDDWLRERHVSFRTGSGEVPFHVDAVPRVIEADEWELLERGAVQRARALNAFAADAHGGREIVAAGIVPARSIDSGDHFEPWMLGVETPLGHAPVVGLDIVRGADGAMRVLEDNTRTPSGLAYAAAARVALDAALPFTPPRGRGDPAAAFSLLTDLLGDPAGAALLSDGPGNSAWYEHGVLSHRLGIPLVTRADLRLKNDRLCAAVAGEGERELRMVYRRTDEDMLRSADGEPTWLAEALLEPVRRGRLEVVNGFGSGVADDKLLHAYVEEMIRFYLGEEPLLPSVRTYDLGDPNARERALARLDTLVFKPRTGHGGHGIVICAHATRADRERIARRVRDEPDRWVAQERVSLSRHPTLCDGRLEPRHVDLRVFTIDGRAVPGALTRVALKRGSLVVNSSQDGGGKDTWSMLR